MLLIILMIAHTYTYKKSVSFTCSSRSSRASQSPLTVEKQPKSTPDMLNPPHPMSEAWIYNIPTWTFIAVVTTVR